MLDTAPDAEILREIVCLLTQRVRAGRATFLLKVKSHRGDPINVRNDTLVEEGRESSCHDTTLRRPTRRPSLPTTDATQRTFV
jgi:hypothetical protein